MLANFKNKISLLIVLLISISLFGCVTPPPRNISNICSMFRQYPKWYWTAQDVQKKWNLPISVLMAVMHQESKFRATIKPPRKRLLGFIPWFRPTSAVGYAQVTNATWRNYQLATGKGGASRTSFYDAADFIGWYANQAHRRVGIPKGDPYKVYLAYHEGIGGYSRRTYLRKQWLMNVARKVQHNAWVYHAQLTRCQFSLPKRPWWHFWSYV